MLPPVALEFIEAVVKAVFDSALEHLPQLEAEWEALHTTTAVDTAPLPADVVDGVNAEIFAAQDAGTAP